VPDAKVFVLATVEGMGCGSLFRIHHGISGNPLILRVVAGVLSMKAVQQKITSFRQLIVWQKSMDLATRCFALVHKFPRSEQTTLGFQIQRSALSIPSNVAEGFSRHSTASYVQHLWIAHASGAELETQIELGRRVGLIDEREGEMLIEDAREVGRIINGLVRSLERAPNNIR
jgi:four helix bundle protein